MALHAGTNVGGVSSAATGSSGFSIGANVTGGTPNTLLYVDSSTAVANGTAIPFGFGATTGNLGVLSNTGSLTFGSASDVSLTRDGAADTFALRRGSNAQRFNLYETTTNSSRLSAYFSGANFFIQTDSANGVSRGLLLRGGQVTQMAFYLINDTIGFGTTAVDYWKMITPGHFVAATDNTLDIGASGATRPRNGFFGGYLLSQNLVSATSTSIAIAGTATTAGAIYTNEGATGNVGFTLPTCSAGLNYSFIVQDSDGLQVTASSGDTIRLGSSVSTAAGIAVSTTIGSAIRLVAANTTEWMAESVVGNWIVT